MWTNVEGHHVGGHHAETKASVEMTPLLQQDILVPVLRDTGEVLITVDLLVDKTTARLRLLTPYWVRKKRITY